MAPKILIVDDYEANILALKDTISSLGAEIESATSGPKALEMLLNDEYALVLMDVNMPEMDGFETVSLMKKRSKTKHTPVIFVTAVNTDEQSALCGYDTGAVDYMYKPLNPDIVINKVRVFLDLYNQQQEIKLLNKELQTINAGLRDFTRIASHDLQEPLRTIGYYSSYLKHLLGDSATEEQLEAAEIVAHATTQMSKLIKDLLAYSKCDWDFESQETALDHCLTESLKNLDAQIGEVKASIKAADLPTVKGSPLMLTQLFQNLIGNALKFVPNGTAPDIEITHSIENGREVFGVKDQGIGFEPEKTDIIFKPFKRLNFNKDYDGNGIGLSTCQKIVQKHGGNLWVDTAPGKGAHFKFTLGGRL